MMQGLGFVAVVCSGLFAGAALYVNLVEHPARMSGGVAAALREWAPSYKRAAVMQATLAMAGSLAGLGAWALGGGSGHLLGAAMFFAVVPFTLLVIRPTNTRLLELHAAGQVGNAPALLPRWNRLHAIRTALGLAAFLVLLGTIAP